MPTVPRSKAVTSNITVPQIPNVQRGAGVEERAEARVGDQISRIGEALLDKRLKAESNDYGMRASKQYIQDLRDKTEEFKDNPTPNKSISQRLEEYSATRMEELREEAPFGAAFENNKRAFNNIGTKAFLDADADERITKVKMQLNNYKEFVDDFGTEQLNSPNPAVILENMDVVQERTLNSSGNLFKEEDIEPRNIENNNFLAGKLVFGMVKNNQEKAAQRLLEGKDHAGIGKQLIKRIDADTLQRLQIMVKNRVKLRGRQSVAEVNEMINDASSRTYEGEVIDPEHMDELDKRIAALPRDKRITAMNKVKIIRAQNEQMRGLKDMTTAEVANSKFKAEGVTMDANERRIFNGRMAVAVHKDLKFRAADPGGYVMTNHAEEFEQHEKTLNEAVNFTEPQEALAIAQAHNALKQRQRAMGLEEMLPVDTLRIYAANLSKGTKDQRRLAIQTMKAGFGDDFNEVMTQVNKLKGFKDDDVIVAAYIGDRETSNHVIENISDKDDIDKRFDLRHDKETLNSLSEAIELEPDYIKFRDALGITKNDNSYVPFMQSMKRQILLNAKSLMADGKSEDVAVTSSMELFISRNFTNMNVENSNVMIPKTINGKTIDQGFVRDFLTKHSTQEGFKSLKIDIPEGRTPENTYEFLEDNAKWEVAGMNRLRLVYIDDKGRKMGVSSGGKPVVFSLTEVSTGNFTVRAPKKFKAKKREKVEVEVPGAGVELREGEDF